MSTLISQLILQLLFVDLETRFNSYQVHKRWVLGILAEFFVYLSH